jgi:hypothetical protein
MGRREGASGTVAKRTNASDRNGSLRSLEWTEIDWAVSQLGPRAAHDDRESICRAIEFARRDLWTLHQLGTDQWPSVEERRRTARELLALEAAAQRMLEAIGGLSPRAKMLLQDRSPVPNYSLLVDIEDPNMASGSDDPDGTRLHNRLDAIAFPLMFLGHDAKAHAERLRTSQAQRGRLPSAAERHFANQLLALWSHFGCPIAPNNRPGSGSPKWPFFSFVQTLGKTVVLDFHGRGAVEAVYREHRESIRLARAMARKFRAKK